MTGDHFRAFLGFIVFSDGRGGVGNVLFQLNYKEAGELFPIAKWEEACDGRLSEVDVDLSYLAGRTINPVFAVQVNGSSAQDWAVWIDARIER